MKSCRSLSHFSLSHIGNKEQLNNSSPIQQNMLAEEGKKKKWKKIFKIENFGFMLKGSVFLNKTVLHNLSHIWPSPYTDETFPKE